MPMLFCNFQWLQISQKVAPHFSPIPYVIINVREHWAASMIFCQKRLEKTTSKTDKLEFSDRKLVFDNCWGFKMFFEETCLLFGNFSQYLRILIILSQISISRSATFVSSTHPCAKTQKNKENTFLPCYCKLIFPFGGHVKFWILL